MQHEAQSLIHRAALTGGSDNPHVRAQPRDARAVAALEQMLRTEPDAHLRRQVHHALKQQDSLYKARADAEARERGIAASSTRKA